MLPITSETPLGQVVAVPVGDRWRVHFRLQELMIRSCCAADGSLRVEVQHPTQVWLVYSTVLQFTASRQQLVGWLERCWQTEVP